MNILKSIMNFFRSEEPKPEVTMENKPELSSETVTNEEKVAEPEPVEETPTEEHEDEDMTLVWTTEYLNELDKNKYSVTGRLNETALKASNWGRVKANMNQPRYMWENTELPMVKLIGDKMNVYTKKGTMVYPHFKLN